MSRHAAKYPGIDEPGGWGKVLLYIFLGECYTIEYRYGCYTDMRQRYFKI